MSSSGMIRTLPGVMPQGSANSREIPATQGVSRWPAPSRKDQGRNVRWLEGLSCNILKRLVAVMSGTSDKAHGFANEAMGKAKQGVGSAVGSDKLKQEGAAQEVKGDAQKAVGDAKHATKDAVDKTADALKQPL
jgi:uncharacterized protein YjbJ (UPF0337 family)